MCGPCDSLFRLPDFRCWCAVDDLRRLEQLIRSQHPCITIPTNEEEYALSLLRDASLQFGGDLWFWTAVDGLRDGLLAKPTPIKNTEHPAAALFYLAQRMENPSLCATLDLADHLEDKKVLRLLRELIAKFKRTGSVLIMVDHADTLPSVVSAHATKLVLSLPDEKELEAIAKGALKRMHRGKKIEVAIGRSAWRTIIRNLCGLNRRQADRIIVDAVADDRRFDEQDMNTIMSAKRRQIQSGSLLEYVECPVDLNDIGGISRLKRWLKQRNNALSDEAEEFGLVAPRGVLMLGVQGAGKSLCAKAIATAWQRPLLRMDPGALYDRYIGESERRLRDALTQAEMMAPIVLWIDEIEKAFASAASRSSDGGLSQRMFGSLLTWMQEHTAPVFLVATANDIEALPPELLRKGRFDEIFFVDLPKKTTRSKIFAIHLRKRKRDPGKFDLPALADASGGFSGAEIEQAVISALHDAFADDAKLTTERIVATLRESPPLSVTMAGKVQALRQWAKGRCVPAD